MSYESEQVVIVNTELATLHDQCACLWQYNVGHRILQIVVGDPLARKNNLVLYLEFCERISGPTSWKNQRLEVILTSKELFSSGRYHRFYILRDESVGFYADGSLFYWRQNFDIHGFGMQKVTEKPVQKKNNI